MFHVPAHRATTAAQLAINVNAKVDCPRCGGYPELDETGRAYTCFFCCDRGLVSLDLAFGEYANEAAGRAAYDLECVRRREENARWDALEAAEAEREYQAWRAANPELAAESDRQLAEMQTRPVTVCGIAFDDDIPF